MENILENLNKEQLSAVGTTGGSLLILAGAGSGKTKVLTSRIAYMVQNSVSPKNILAVTFTNKAAKEMKVRLAAILGENTVKYMWVGTFHSICGRILRQDIDKYVFQSGRKLDKNFTIYDEQDSVAVIKQVIKKLNLDEKMYQPKLVKSIISNAKNKMQDAYTFATYARDFKTQRISRIFDEYETVLNNNNAIDFDDMLMLCVRLLEQNPEVREKYYNRFEHILVDEFQDTNPAQYNLVKMLYTNNLETIPGTRSLCVVGDVDQSIYSWRGADFRIILNFQNDFKDCKLIKLEQNYRSTAKILNAANAVIENNEQRVDKVLYSNKGEGEKITYYEADDDADEANFIASTIKNTSANYNRFAVLYRTNAQSRSIEEACISHGIPYKIYGGLKFYDRKEIKDAIAYLKLIYNLNDSQSLKRIINIPKRSIGDTTIKHLQDYADANDISLYQAIQSVNDIETIQSRTKTKLEEFAELLKYFQEVQDRYSLHEYISFVLEKSGYLRELKSENTPEDEARIENLQELVNVASEFIPEDTGNILGEFLAQVSLVSDIDGMEQITNNITLMTLHSAKGLEFPTVFLAGLEDGIFPHSRTFNSQTELEEERRLMYVGVTRAEEKLYLTGAKRRQMWGEYKYYTPSRFIDEIPPELVEMVKSTGHSTGKTFRNAVETIRTGEYKSGNTISTSAKKLGNPQRKSDYNRNPEYTISSGTRKLGNPSKRNTDRTPSRTILVKSETHKKRDEEKVKAFFENNPIKRKLEERKKQQEQQALLEQQREAEKNAPIDYFYNVGERVFHDKLGVGHILEVTKIGESTMYTIDFGKMGKKAMDASYARLKKF
ncbi:MAG: UvrD-helicase domain-containing protein [Candidatus Gastranaerophilales bacterium]|nr:UvrD-helicase domain-containing protein [Candidatus Gastranaerophilales bacterium]